MSSKKYSFEKFDFILAVFALFLGTALSTMQFAQAGIVKNFLFKTFSDDQIYGSGGVGGMLGIIFYASIFACTIIFIYLLGKGIIILIQNYKNIFVTIKQFNIRYLFNTYKLPILVYSIIIFLFISWVVITNYVNVNNTKNIQTVDQTPFINTFPKTTDEKIDDLTEDIQQLTNSIDRLILYLEKNPPK